MKKINEILLILIFILTAVLAAAVGFKAYDVYDTKRQLAREQEELERAQVFERNREAQSRVQEMRAEIMERTEDREELERFITQIQSGGSQETTEQLTDNSAYGNVLSSGSMTVSGNTGMFGYGTVSDNAGAFDYGTVSGNAGALGYGTVSGNTGMFGYGTVSGNAGVFGYGTVSGNAGAFGYGTVSGNVTVSGNGMVSGNGTVSGNGAAWNDGTVSANASVSDNRSVSGNDSGYGTGVSGNGAVNYYDGSMAGSSIFDAWRGIYEQPEGMSLAQRRELRTSLQETLEVNQSDRERIAENRYDFSGLKIACLGDSITAASNLESEEGYQQYSYPARLKELLGAEEVYNLGVGGSSIGRYWSDPYVERYREIPEDTDVIIVMGGTNDGFCVSDKEFGNLDDRAQRTFCGDLDELMRGLREHYPNAEIFFATPLPNVLQDYLMSEREYLLPQQRFVETITTLAQEYDYEVIDLYNSNILDSHDANVVAEYIPDGVHGSHAGYQVMAEHFAAQIIEHYDESTVESAEPEESVGTEEEAEAEETDAVETTDSEESDDSVETEDGAEEEGTASKENADAGEDTEGADATEKADAEGTKGAGKKDSEAGDGRETENSMEKAVEGENTAEAEQKESNGPKVGYGSRRDRQ